MLIADGADINPKMAVRWQAFLAWTRKTNNSVFVAWHRYSALPVAEFAARAAAVPLGDVHPLVRRAFTLPPRSLTDVAESYSRLLNDAYDRATASLLAGAPAIECADPAETDLRALVRSPEYPPNVSVADYGDLDLLPDRPSQDELKKLREAVEKWRATGPGAPPRAMALVDAATPTTPRVFLRGNPYNLGPATARQFSSRTAQA